MPIEEPTAIICDCNGKVISVIYPNELKHDILEYRCILERESERLSKMIGD